MKKGVNNVNFQPFDKAEIERYSTEVKERWGGTAAYREYQEKTNKQTAAETEQAAGHIMSLFARLGALKHLPPKDAQAQNIIRELQEFISEHYYTCTDDILKELGQMYACDARMKRNIDNAGGEGTAEFAAQVISFF